MSSSADNTAMNVKNAFAVVVETYRNLHKFFSELDSVGSEEGFISLTPNFLRWRTDRDLEGWLIRSFVKLFQQKDHQLHAAVDDLRDGPVYGVEIAFDD